MSGPYLYLGALFFLHVKLEYRLAMTIYVKESLVNLLSLVTFIAPIVLILYYNNMEMWKKVLSLWAGLTVLTLAYPPVGSWLRPHRHSDKPFNRDSLPLED